MYMYMYACKYRAVKTHFLSIVLLIASKQEVLGTAAVDEHGLLTDEVDSALGLYP